MRLFARAPGSAAVTVVAAVLLLALAASARAGAAAKTGGMPVVFGSVVVGGMYNPATGNFPGVAALDRTYDDGKTAQVELGDGSPVFALADQLNISNQQGVWGEIQNSDHANFSDFYSDRTTVTSHDSWFSHSETTHRTVAERMFLRNQSFAALEQAYMLYELGISTEILLYREFPLTPRMQRVLDALPDTYSSDNTSAEYWAYNDFFSTYGGMVVRGVKMGGKLTSEVWFDSCFYSKYDGNFVSEQSGWSFIVVTHLSGWQSASQHLCQHWAEYSETIVDLRGGDTGYFAPTQWDTWWSTVAQFPVPVQLQVMPVEDCLRDDERGRQLYANLQVARGDYYDATIADIVAHASALPKPTAGWITPAWCTAPTKECT